MNFQKVARDKRYCKVCAGKSIDDEEHSLGVCKRGWLSKVKAYFGIVEVLESDDIEVVQEDVYGLMPLIDHLSTDQMKLKCWKLIAACMAEISNEIRTEKGQPDDAD